MSLESFKHIYQPASQAGQPTLLLLHGTGGDEQSLLPLAPQLVPSAAVLSVRGNILENGNPRFFRRLAEGVFDEANLIEQAAELAAFLQTAAAHYGFSLASLVAVGYSNGANIAGSLLLLHPDVLSGAILLRPMLPLHVEPLPDLQTKRIFIAAGQYDPLIPHESVEALSAALDAAGADLTFTWLPVDHRLTLEELNAARDWLGA